MHRFLTRFVIGVFAFTLAFQSSAAADDGKTFPKDHRDRLGGSSDAWLFGKDDGDATDGQSGPDNGDELLVGPNVRVNAPQQAFPNGLLGRSETAIASRENGRFIVVGFNDAQGFCGAPFGSACTPQTPPGLSGYAFSTNGGLTFTDGGGPTVFGGVLTRGDPWLDRGGSDNKTFFYANLAVNATTGANLGVSVHRGSFSESGSSATFAWRDVRVFNSPNGSRDFYDKEAIAVDHKGGGFGVVSLTNFKELCGQPQFGFGQIEVWRTTDGGNTWQGPAIAGPEAADSVAACGFTGTLQQSSVPAIGPNGEVYVTWQFGPTFGATSVSTNAAIVAARSLDGGVTFGAPITVSAINSLRQDTPVGYNRGRFNDHPRISVATSGEHKGRVFVSFTSALTPVAGPSTTQALVSTQIFVSHSDDQGATWSAPTPVAPTPSATRLKRFWPVVTTDADGVNVVYNESREQPIASGVNCNVGIGSGLRRIGPAHSLVDTFVARSNDGGQTFGAPVRVSTATSDWCTGQANIRPNFGDYISSFQDGKRVLAAWGDSRNGPVDTFFAAITAD